MNTPQPILGSLRKSGVGLRCTCQDQRCLHYATLPPEKLQELNWPDDFTIEDIERRLKCRRCGCRHVDAQPDYPTPGGYPYAR